MLFEPDVPSFLKALEGDLAVVELPGSSMYVISKICNTNYLKVTVGVRKLDPPNAHLTVEFRSSLQCVSHSLSKVLDCMLETVFLKRQTLFSGML